MPRPHRFDRQALVETLLPIFWRRGYHATSIADLTAAGVSRQALYSAFADKRAAFLACLESYGDLAVTPAFEQVERPDANLPEITAYFEFQLAAAERHGLPGPGCFIANTMTECAPHDAEIAGVVASHHKRLKAGFRDALCNAGVRDTDLPGLSELAATTAHGLWSMSRLACGAGELRSVAAALIKLVETLIERKSA